MAMAAGRLLFALGGILAVDALQSSLGARTSDGPTASFLPDAQHLCIEGDAGYLVKYLANLRQSPLQSHYTESQIEPTTCAERGYKNGPTDGKCFKETTNWFDGQEHEHPSEAEAFAEYAQANSMTLKQAMKSMSKFCQAKKKQPPRPWLSTTARPAAAQAPPAQAAAPFPAMPRPGLPMMMGPPVAFWGYPMWR